MRLYRGLEYVKAQRTVAVRLHFLTLGVDRGGHIFNERHHIAQKFHHATHTHVLKRTDAEHRVYRAVDQPLAYAFTHFILGKMALVEKFFHEGLVIFGSGFHELLMQLACMFELVLGYILYRGDASVGTPRVFLHKQHVDKGIESRTALERILYGYHLFAEYVTHLLYHIFVIGLLAVKLVDGKYDRLVERRGSAEYVLSTNLHPILGIYEDYTRIGHVESRYSVAHKVVTARTVDHVELFVEKFGIEYGRKNRVTIFLLYWKIVTHCIFGIYGATAFYHSTLKEHRLSECGFTRALASKQGDVFDFVSLIDLHGVKVLILVRNGKVNQVMQT